MPRRRLPPRLHLRGGRSPGWIIKDGAREIRTGYGPERSAEDPAVQAALGGYLNERAGQDRAPRTAERLTVGEALAFYGAERGPAAVDPDRIADCIKALAPFWGDLAVTAVREPICRRYDRERRAQGIKPGTIRRELGCLSSALRYCVKAGHLIEGREVWLPDKPEPRDRWLTRGEAARLLRAVRRQKRAHHVARLILIGVYTGTRPGAILKLQWTPNTDGGHVDLEHGMLYRKSRFARTTKKRQTPARIPRQLLAHLRRWRKLSVRHIVEYDGGPVKSVKRAWATACADAGLEDVNRHTLRHTAITWAMQRGVELADAAGYFGVSMDTLERVYFHHHPDFQGRAVAAMERK